jgi:hypothetical protein
LLGEGVVGECCVGREIRWVEDDGLQVRVAVEAEQADGTLGVVEDDQADGIGSGRPDGEGRLHCPGERGDAGVLQQAQHLDELPEDLTRIAALMNDRPRKTLGFMKPSEKLAELVAMTP